MMRLVSNYYCRFTRTFPVEDMILSQREKTAVNKLRALFNDVRPTSGLIKDDLFLLRWLRGHDMDVTKTAQVLRDSLQWREQHLAVTRDHSDDIYEKVKKALSFSYLGPSNDGNPVWICRLGRIDLIGIMIAAGKATVERCIYENAEKMFQLLQEESHKSGKLIPGNYLILDMDGINFYQISITPGTELIKSTVQILTRNYPESVAKVVVVNANNLYDVVLELVKPFLDKITLGKICIQGEIFCIWKAVLLKDMDPSILPVYWGGARTDEDGSITCQKMIAKGGAISYDILQSRQVVLSDTVLEHDGEGTWTRELIKERMKFPTVPRTSQFVPRLK